MTRNEDLRGDCIFLGGVIRATFGNKDGILTLLDKRNTLLPTFKSILKLICSIEK